MKLMKKVVAITLSTVLTVGMACTTYAEPLPLHAVFGTEKEHGENNHPHGNLHEGEYDSDFGQYGETYCIIPKNDTISFDIDPSHNVEARWWRSGVHIYEMEEGKIALNHGGDPDKIEKVIAWKEYPVFPTELQEAAVTKKKFDYGSWSDYDEKYSNEPFIILEVTDYDLGWTWFVVYQVVDNWSGAGSTGNGQTTTWVNDNYGWRVLNTDGTYLTNTWYQSPASSLWYYIGADGYMLTNTITPDGYKVNADGVWVQ